MTHDDVGEVRRRWEAAEGEQRFTWLADWEEEDRQVRPPTAAELVEWLWGMPEGPERDFLEECHWLLAARRCGTETVSNWRWEYEWLRGQR